MQMLNEQGCDIGKRFGIETLPTIDFALNTAVPGICRTSCLLFADCAKAAGYIRVARVVANLRRNPSAGIKIGTAITPHSQLNR